MIRCLAIALLLLLILDATRLVGQAQAAVVTPGQVVVSWQQTEPLPLTVQVWKQRAGSSILLGIVPSIQGVNSCTVLGPGSNDAARWHQSDDRYVLVVFRDDQVVQQIGPFVATYRLTLPIVRRS